MITAKETRSLYDHSSAEVKAYLAKIDPVIREAAKDGKQFVVLYVDGLWEAVQYQSRMTPIQASVKTELETLGFRVTYGKVGDGYIPRGLMNDDGKGPIYYNTCLTVGW
jgi:imidazole glycerol phosphate synthase subunit HisF